MVKKIIANMNPNDGSIAIVNKLYDAGHEIKYMTTRGAVSKVDYYELTQEPNWKVGEQNTQNSVLVKKNTMMFG